MKISPSLMSADLLSLESIIKFFNKNADMLHVDIMDGHFVKNIAMSPQLIKHVRRLSEIPIEAHLMMEDPEVLIKSCISAGAEYITIHVEPTNGSTLRILSDIKNSNGCRAGIAVNPETPFSQIRLLLPYVDLVTFMTIDPGFPGTAFIYEVLDKVREAVKFRKEKNLNFEIQVDGSVGPDTYQAVKDSGTDFIIAGEPTLYNLDSSIEHAWVKMLHFMNGGEND